MCSEYKDLSTIKSTSRTNLVIEQILNSILDGNLKEGDILPPENKLCDIFGVSRTVLREAVKILSSRGILEVKQGAGTLVRRPKDEIPENALSEYIKFNEFTLIQLMEVRWPLEVEMAKLVARRCNLKYLKQLKNTIERMKNGDQSVEAYVYQDDVFHRTLAEATENPIFGVITRSIVGLLHASRQLTISHYGIDIVIEEHNQIYKAIEHKNSDAAVDAMRVHMSSTMMQLEKLVLAKRDSNEG